MACAAKGMFQDVKFKTYIGNVKPFILNYHAISEADRETDMLKQSTSNQVD